MYVYTAKEMGEHVGNMVKHYLWRSPEEVQQAHVKVVEEAVDDGDLPDVYIVLHGTWACGLAADEVSGVESADIVHEAAKSPKVFKAIEAEIKRLLECYGHVVEEE